MFRGLAEIFVNAFGITKPAPEREEQIGMLIAVALVGVIAMVAVAAVTLFKILT